MLKMLAISTVYFAVYVYFSEWRARRRQRELELETWQHLEREPPVEGPREVAKETNYFVAAGRR
jgi:hypothetical protein